MATNPAIRIYTAKLSQADAEPPTVTVLHNRLEGTPVWTRAGAGTYDCTLANSFPVGKTIVIISGNGQTGVGLNGSRTGNNTVRIVAEQGGTPQDDLMSEVSLEIRVYK